MAKVVIQSYGEQCRPFRGPVQLSIRNIYNALPETSQINTGGWECGMTSPDHSSCRFSDEESESDGYLLVDIEEA